MHTGPAIEVVTSLRNNSIWFGEHWCQQGLMQTQRLLFFAREPMANEAIDFAMGDAPVSADANVLDFAAVAQISDVLARNTEQPRDLARLQHRIHEAILVSKHKKHNTAVQRHIPPAHATNQLAPRHG
jgi:hypothetical protein